MKQKNTKKENEHSVFSLIEVRNIAVSEEDIHDFVITGEYFPHLAKTADDNDYQKYV